ncbi:hypothetical protein [Allorhodopirellula solitaria]|uniref:hypothetical protein n=1 Tax=Allorhodopirellula solitaria TaxID=2527987 RepID=UPI001645842D|nr:hypothetical protein [Allorhodopirellula solitaria]
MPTTSDREAVLVARRVSEDHLFATQNTAFSSLTRRVAIVMMPRTGAESMALA